MNTNKYILLTAVALLMFSTAAATSVQGEIENPGASELSWSDKWIPDFGGFLDITAGQQTGDYSPEHDNELVVNQPAQFRASELCTASTIGEWMPFIGGDTVDEVGVAFQIEPAHGHGETELLIAKEPGYISQVESNSCYDITMDDVYVPDRVMTDDYGEYEFRARFVTYDDNGDLHYVKGEPDVGTITLKPKLDEEEDLRADIDISPSTVGEPEIADGERTLVQSDTELTFSAEDIQGEVGNIEWTLRDIEDARNMRTIYESSGEEMEYNFPRDAEGAYSIGIRLEHEYTQTSWGTSHSFYVQSQETPSPEAVIDASSTTVTQGDTVTFSLDQSEAPESSIRHYGWSTGRNDMVMEKQFNNAGTYEIEGYVVNEEGKEDSDTVYVQVQEDTSYEHDESRYYDDSGEQQTSDVEEYRPQIVSVNAPGTVEVDEEFDMDVQATHRADNPGLEYDWDFGETGQSITHSFEMEGTYDATVTVTDSSGDSVTESVSILVQEGQLDVATPPPRLQEASTDNLDLFFDGQVRTAVQTSSFLNFFSVAAEPEKVEPNTRIDENLSVSTDVEAEENLEQGYTSKIVARPAIIEDGEATWAGEWEEIQGGSHEHRFDREFDTNGYKAYLLVLAEAESEFDFAQEEWSDYSASSLDQDRYVFEVEGADKDHSTGEEPDTLDIGVIALAAAFLLLVVGLFAYFARKEK